jgi:hypothetical protein
MSNINIAEKTDNYATNLRNTYDEIQLLANQVKKMDPANIRKNYDKYWDIIDKNETETNQELEVVDESINNLEDSKELLEKIKEIIQNVKTNMNSLRIGTLQGITRQTIKENDIVPEPNDEIALNVVNQKYNELKDINKNKGGTKKYKKKYNRKSKRSKKRSNKYK